MDMNEPYNMNRMRYKKMERNKNNQQWREKTR